jgi:hypothetical protein
LPAFEKSQRQQRCGKFLSAMPLPMAQMGKVLFSAWRTKITGLAFVNRIVWIILRKRNGGWQSAFLCVWARFTVQMRWYNAGANEMIRVDVAVRR